MMSNLFSLFDPSLSSLGLIWLFIIIPLLMLPSSLWFSNLFINLMSYSFLFIKKELDYVLSYPMKGKGYYSFFFSIFLMLFFYNFFALFPFFFSMTSHMLVTLPLSFIFWLGIILSSWVFSLKGFLCHLVPSGTPLSLMSFMVLVEMLSNFIRPIALTFRLTANMMAGHLLMSLIGGALISLSIFPMLLGSGLQFFLVFMELGVSFIQSYVFCTLLLLYASEMSH